jgi:hypothetical protein
METLIATLATVIIAVFTGLVWKINNRMARLTGVMESHSTIMLRMEAKKQGIPIEWWDPTINDFPREGKHQEQCELKTIYLALDPKLRENPPESACYQLGLFVRDFWDNLRTCRDDFLRGRRSTEDPEQY